MDDVKLEITPEAERTIAAMRDRVNEVARLYGEHSPQHVEMLRSLTDALMHVLRLGGRISKDDELGLLGVSFIVYGVVFFAKRIDGERHTLLGDWSVHS